MPVVPEEYNYKDGPLRLAVELANRLVVCVETPIDGVHPTKVLETANSGGGTFLVEFTVLWKGDGRPNVRDGSLVCLAGSL